MHGNNNYYLLYRFCFDCWFLCRFNSILYTKSSTVIRGKPRSTFTGKFYLWNKKSKNKMSELKNK